MNQVPATESASASVPAQAAASTLSAQEPWPGLASYAEEDTSYFAAREAERDELLERVLQHRLTVLYGLSGLGKSSLVKAGLFPMLRTHQCLPVYVRLNFASEAAALVDQVFAAIAAAAQTAGAKMPVRQSDETLWEYFQRQGNAFWSQRNRLLTPVLVFDQFEEIFTLGAFRRADESKAFLEAIADLAEGRAPSAVKARLDRSPAEASRNFDFNRQACHVLLSLREDYLAYLEDLRRLMPSMGNHMRLRPLSGTQAMIVVRKPGGSLVTQAVAGEIVTAVVGARQRQRPAAKQEVDPALLSLLCRELNKRRLKEAAAQISAEMLTEQVRAGILGDFYEEAIGRVSKTTRRFVEDKLLLASGQRDSVALEVAHEAGVDDAQIDTLVDERLVRREERGGIVRLELTHDVLTDVVRASRDQRREREAREQAQQLAQETEKRLRKSRRFAFAMAVLALVAIGLLGLIADAYYWAKNNFLPPDSMLTLQRFRLGYAPLPDLTEKPISPGSFNMGEQDAAFIANLGELEKHFGVPSKAIEITQPFYLGKNEITYDQYDYYVWQQHRSGDTETKFPNTGQGGRGDRPVVNVNLSEAMGYVAWLGKQTGQNCRLPMEAEWEYAARAGTVTAYYWGDEVGSNHANCNGCGSPWGNKESAPVGSFAANQFGLYDMSGNVWEWTCSNRRERFDGSEQQCNDETTDAQSRVVRGGSWDVDPDGARSSARGISNPAVRNNVVGFRVLCESPIE
ncbi:formylglycine-generating enzyme required for sulfatase activity [Nitrosomonas sp. Nm84]|uniref:SUMF1/EgtB/PvdO family nonheme iron enzyme n=1 Tax=Nitrosomonas sp. Nm84 TaxID=200124 RepID=UPI000D75CBE6|nr:SUMF1/EgtB/PvdO family nonheme iron enzyme [Nitrosomonas sp. Nm84]PXW88905.1 formylglycine-generating enzyme required for sulfatase activity [Nitrosomonas sp. Nm84]